MGPPDQTKRVTQTATEEVRSDQEDEVVHVNHEHGERMDGAFLSIVWSASIPCGLIIIITAVLLGIIYGREVDRNRGWPELQLPPINGTSTGFWASVNSWRKHGGNAAIFVKFNPSSLTAVASLTGKIIPYLSSSIMALVAFFVARRIIVASREGHELLTPHQMSILIQLLGGNSYAPLKDCVHYHVKHKKRWLSPIPHAFSALAVVTALGFIIPIADTWFSTTVTPATVETLQKVEKANISLFGRDAISSTIGSSCAVDKWSYTEDLTNFKIPCNSDMYLYDNSSSAQNDSTKRAYNLFNMNEAGLTMVGYSNTSVLAYNPPRPDGTPDYEVNAYSFLADYYLDSSRDFRARTYAVRTQCAPMTAKCFPSTESPGPDQVDEGLKFINDNYTFQCGPDYTGEVTSNGASFASGLRVYSNSSSVGIGFAPDANLSRMIGNDSSKVEFASYTNPLYFGTWSLGWGTASGDTSEDLWHNDTNILLDQYNSYVWMLNCSATAYDVTYDWINGSVAHWNEKVVTDQEFGGMVSYPFVSGLSIAQTCLEYASARMMYALDSNQLAFWWGDEFSQCAVAMMSATFNQSSTILEQTRNNNYGATRVPIVPLFVLLGIKFLYCMAVFGLAVAAYQFTNPSESQSVKERLSVKGLAATAFAEANTHQQVAVQNVEQLFQQPRAQDAEAAPPPDVKVGMVMTELGGWAFVKMAAGKVFETVSPIVQANVMAVAKGGQFGSDGQNAADWISMVKH
ncbi:hypothetical protein PV11_02333 [Exophiala sideris]|uniref:Uncharacterized protein n=1 Tax=Exophiala sideris TaxID=1016849 RepID=A0A0D1ZIU8_9EURO|nr:hypothetical protein PV11_02333 [Exophiala sideris]